MTLTSAEIVLRGMSTLDDPERNMDRRKARLSRTFEAGLAMHKQRMRFMTLTSERLDVDLTEAWSALVKRIRRKYGKAFEYLKVKTEEGLGTLHIVFWGTYIPQSWLKRAWEELTGAFIVDIRALYRARGLKNYLSPYLQGQSARLSYSFGWVYRGWRAFWELKLLKERLKWFPLKFGSPFCLLKEMKWFYSVKVPPIWKQFLDDLNRGLRTTVAKAKALTEWPHALLESVAWQKSREPALQGKRFRGSMGPRPRIVAG